MDALEEIKIQPPDFFRFFKTLAQVPTFALQVLQPALVDFILHTDPRWTFELVGGTLMVSSKRLPPEELSLLFQAARDFVSHIPQSLRE